MSDRLSTVVQWLKWIAQAIGVILTLIGGSQAVQIANNPEAFSSPKNIGTSGTLTVTGILTTVLAPGIAWAFKSFMAWKSGKGATPVIDYAAALVSLNVLAEYLKDKPAAVPHIDGLKTLVVAAEADKVVPVAKVG